MWAWLPANEAEREERQGSPVLAVSCGGVAVLGARAPSAATGPEAPVAWEAVAAGSTANPQLAVTVPAAGVTPVTLDPALHRADRVTPAYCGEKEPKYQID